MKITKLETIPIKLKMATPFVISNVTMDAVYYVIVKTTFDNGIIGFGEATPAWEVTGETYQSVVGYFDLLLNKYLLGYTVLGKEVNSLEEIEKIIEDLDPTSSSQLIYGNSAAKAAFEQSLLDALGKSINKPIYEIFKAKNRPIPSSKTISIDSVDKTLEKIQDSLNHSYSVIRLKVGVREACDLNNYERDVQSVIQGRDLIQKSGKDVKLAADANQGFGDVATTVEFCHKIEGCLDWLEQPTIASNISAFKELKKLTSVPIMADEAAHSYEDVKNLLDLGGIDFINVKLMKAGGLLKSLKIIDLAQTYGVRCQIGSMIENSLGVSMGCHAYLIRPNVISTDLNAYTFLAENLGEGVKIENDFVILDANPGCGIKINETLINKYRV
ncbi:MAG: enolase C-terminal domain-like protein [bacterium]|nr:enolase C-terminal domain-like protein [bacterium]